MEKAFYFRNELSSVAVNLIVKLGNDPVIDLVVGCGREIVN
jgi:hypothetical protein